MSIDQSLLQQTLVQLAATTLEPDLMANPDLPDTWKSLTTQTVNASPFSKIQLLLSYGNVGDDVIACLSIGLPWSNVIGHYTSGFSPDDKSALDESVVGCAPDSAVVQSMYVSAYFFLRSQVWDILSFLDNPGVKGKPLYITGIGLGGPLAQIVALDFRPGNKGPSNKLLPWSVQPPSYVFSTGNFASIDFQQYFNQTVTDAYNVRAGSQALKVDHFPLEPDNTEGTQKSTFAPLGTLNEAPIATPIPFYTPWEVRDSNFYLKALGGTPPPFPASSTQIPNPPSGFSQTVAFSIGQFVADIYKQSFNPGNPAPGKLVKSLNFGTSPALVGFFSTSNSLVVVFRGSINYQEFLMMDANSVTATTPYRESISSGVQQLLYSAVDGDPTLAQQVREQINELLNELQDDKKTDQDDIKLYLSGHGTGGALANAMAADISFNTSDDAGSPVNKPDAIYTYGATYFAGNNLAQQFSNCYGNASYQIRRLDDDVATALKAQPYWNPVSNSVVLLGALSTKENTYHSLSSYLELLNPQRPQH